MSNNVILATLLNGFSWHQQQLVNYENELIRFDQELINNGDDLSKYEIEMYHRAQEKINEAAKAYEILLADPKNREKYDIALLTAILAKTERDLYEQIHEGVQIRISDIEEIRVQIHELFNKRMYNRTIGESEGDLFVEGNDLLVEPFDFEFLNLDEIETS